MPACAGDLPLSIYHSCALPTELHGIPYIYEQHHRSRLNCFALSGILFSPALPFVFHFVCCCVTATIQPSILTTSLGLALLPICSSTTYPVSCRFGNYRSRLLSFVWPYFTALFHAVFFLATRDWSLSLPFQLMALHDPLRDYSPPLLPLCIQYIQPTCRDCTLHVPRRWWQWTDSNHRSSYCYIPVAPADRGRTLQSALSAYRLSLP